MGTSGTGKVFKLPLNSATLQRYLIYSLQIGRAVTDASGNAVSPRAIRINDDDNDGMADDWEKKWFGSITAKDGTVDSDRDGLTDLSEYNYARSNPGWGSNRWALSPLNQDSDGDSISDKYEVSFGLNPVSLSDRDLDLDGDGWSNYQEYLYGFAANDPNAHPQASIDIVELIPMDNAGIPPDTIRVPNNTVAAVRLESTNGIDITNPQAVSLSVNDGEMTYTRNAYDRNANGQEIVRLVPLETDGNIAYSLWVSYYRTNETTIANLYRYEATVEVTVQVMDVEGVSLEPAFVSFKAYCIEAELANNKEVVRMVDEIEAKGTTIDIVFNNAAVQLTYRKDYLKTPIEDLDLSLRVNFIAVAMICYRLLPKMIERGFGRVINLTSGIRDQPEQAGYSASKAALDKFTNDLGYKLNGTDVIISLTDPGWCRTDLGGPNADHDPEDSIPGVAVGAFVNDKTSGRFFNATNFIGMSLEEAVKKGEAQKASN